jgi:hypothetical protein
MKYLTIFALIVITSCPAFGTELSICGTGRGQTPCNVIQNNQPLVENCGYHPDIASGSTDNLGIIYPGIGARSCTLVWFRAWDLRSDVQCIFDLPHSYQYSKTGIHARLTVTPITNDRVVRYNCISYDYDKREKR